MSRRELMHKLWTTQEIYLNLYLEKACPDFWTGKATRRASRVTCPRCRAYLEKIKARKTKPAT